MKEVPSFLYVANWKMNQSLEESINFFKNNLKELQELSQNQTIPLVFCPSFPAIPFILHEIDSNDIYIGAQNCSPHPKGAYTGEVAAHMLGDLGCTFCIVGHSERRKNFGESNFDIALKAEQLIINKLIPILCIGETLEDHEQALTKNVLHDQLVPVLDLLKDKDLLNSPLCIAYEPVWSIGTGLTPTPEGLAQSCEWIHELLNNYKIADYAILYGGSITSENSYKLKTVAAIDGFLIGGASLDFQEFKKIVLS